MYCFDIIVLISVTYAVLLVYAAPMGSISSMEVNVDVLEQMDLMDVSDQEALDVFLNSGSGADEGALASPPPGALFASEPKLTHCHCTSRFVINFQMQIFYKSRLFNVSEKVNTNP